MVVVQVGEDDVADLRGGDPEAREDLDRVGDDLAPAPPGGLLPEPASTTIGGAASAVMAQERS